MTMEPFALTRAGGGQRASSALPRGLQAGRARGRISPAPRGAILVAAVSLLLLGSPPAVRGAQLLVSPDGNDVAGDGSPESPYKSVQAAVDNAWDHDVIVLAQGVHTSDTDIVFGRKKLTVRGADGPITRAGGCWPVHTGDVAGATLTRCNVTSWPQVWGVPRDWDESALDSTATSVQEWPASFRDDGAGVPGFHGRTLRPIPSSEGGDFADPGDSPRGNPEDWTCGGLGCVLGFSGAGNLQAGVRTNSTLIGARFVFLTGDEVILRDLDVRGAWADEGYAGVEPPDGGCLSASGDAAITVADSVFSQCRARMGGGAVSLGLGSNVWFNGVRFLNNSAPRGGAVLANMPADVRMVNCEFSGNTADQGAALYTTDTSSPAFFSCDFYAGSAIRGGAIATDGQSSPSFHDCAFVHNMADDGAVAFAEERSTPSFANCTFQNNSAQRRGGVLFAAGTSIATIQSSWVFFNRAGAAAGVYSTTSRAVHVTDTVFGRNRARQGHKDLFPRTLLAQVFGDPNANNTACGGRGVFSGEEWGCVCAEPYRGVECEVTCPGFSADNGTVCSGHGVCGGVTAQVDRECMWTGGRRWFCLDVGVGLCSCDYGYGGRECQLQCPGMGRTDDPTARTHQVCSGHGACVTSNGSLACACDFGWGSEDCSRIRLYVSGSGGTETGRRMVRLGDVVLANSAERGLHLLALNRSDLTVVWDRNYDLGAAPVEPSLFGPGLDNDGTINVATGASADGTQGALDAADHGSLSLGPQQGERFYGEEDANELARDLSLFDARHLIIVTSAVAWEYGTNLAVVQALGRCGAPDLASYVDAAMGGGRAFALIGVPDSGVGNGTYIIGAHALAEFANFSFAELSVNLEQAQEVKEVRWCGKRVYDKGIDVSHINGTTCATQDGENMEEANVTVSDNVTNTNSSNSSNATDELEASPGPAMALRWQVVGRTLEPSGAVRLEEWDLDADVDPTLGLVPEVQSSLTTSMSCCNRSAHWNHGTCPKGGVVVQDTGAPEVLRCVASGWFADEKDAVFGDASFAGSSFETLRGNDPEVDRQPSASHWGIFTLYEEPEYMRSTPFDASDIGAPRPEDIPSESLSQLRYGNSLRFTAADPRFVT